MLLHPPADTAQDSWWKGSRDNHRIDPHRSFEFRIEHVKVRPGWSSWYM